MDYETFLSFFDKMKVEKDIKIGEYKVSCRVSPYIQTSGDTEAIYYYRDGYKIGEDFIDSFYALGDIMPTVKTSFDNENGIKNYNKLIDYLDYLYNTNIERLKQEELEREQALLEQQREKELQEKKLNDFLGI